MKDDDILPLAEAMVKAEDIIDNQILLRKGAEA